MLKANCRNTFLHKSSKGSPTSHQISWFEQIMSHTAWQERKLCSINFVASQPCKLSSLLRPSWSFSGTYLCCLFGQHLGKEKQAWHLSFPLHGGKPPWKGSNSESTLPFPGVRGRKDSSCLTSMLLPQDKENYFTPDGVLQAAQKQHGSQRRAACERKEFLGLSLWRPGFKS